MQKKKDYLPQLLKYIDLANSFSSIVYFPNRFEVVELTVKRLGRPAPTLGEIIETYNQILGTKMPEKVKKFVFNVNENDENKKFKIILDRFDLIYSLVNTFTRLAYCVTETYHHPSLCVHEFMDEWDTNYPEMQPFLSVALTIDRKGCITTKTNEFYDFMVNNQIEGYRIRNCIACDKIFWASRVDKWTCSKSCGNRARQNIWMEQNREKYNERRRENYAFNKLKKKQKEEKKSGTL